MSKIKEIKNGNRYGRLVIIAESIPGAAGARRWAFMCDCGKGGTAKGYDLVSGRRSECTSCAIKTKKEQKTADQKPQPASRKKGQLIDETGNRYNKTKVVSRARNNDAGAAMWRCVCDCGTEFVAQGTQLRKGRFQSCGNCGHAPSPPREGVDAVQLKMEYERGREDMALWMAMDMLKRQAEESKLV